MPEYLAHLQLQFVGDLPSCPLYHHQIFYRKGRTGQEGITSTPVTTSTSCPISRTPFTPQAYMLRKGDMKREPLTCNVSKASRIKMNKMI